MSAPQGETAQQRSLPARVVRWFLRTVLLVGGPIAIAIGGLTFYLSSGRYVTTENAYVKSELIIITAEVSGRIVEVCVNDNAPVRAGDVLFRIDPQRFEIERDRLKAELGAARQRVEALKGRHRAKLAELNSAEQDAAFMQGELARFEQLRKGSTISESRLVEIRREATRTATRTDVIREEISQVLAELGGDADLAADQHPDVLRWQAALERAEVDLAATTVRAPQDAITANLTLQPGEFVEEADAVMSLVASEGFWVEANLKETDLTHLQEGQAATLRIDAYPDVEWAASVASLSPATGAEYAVLPPQNASGNWVKVVQRVPVRLAIEMPENAPTLRAGMSVAVSIDTEWERPVPDVLTRAHAWIQPALDASGAD
ncbi:MAG: HlyD family secretion protein [Pseudomonadota bacterium]